VTVSDPPPDAVIRLDNVAIDRQRLFEALGQELDRYEKSRDGSSWLAQISLPSDSEEWSAVASYITDVGPRIKDLIDHKLIGSACIDFAVMVRRDSFTRYFTVPAAVAQKAGLNSIDVEMSVYLTDEDNLNVRS
jgi:hypothetical protein